VSSVTSMEYMFMTSPLNQCLSSWAARTPATVVTTNMLKGSQCPNNDNTPDASVGPWCQGASDGCGASESPNQSPNSSSPSTGLCEGDCDYHDSDCGPGLKCFLRSDESPVPGCEGIGVSGFSFCIPETHSVHYSGSLLAPLFPLKICDADCDNDSECGDGLECFFRDYGTNNANATVPGCYGDLVENGDYCVPESQGPTSEPSNVFRRVLEEDTQSTSSIDEPSHVGDDGNTPRGLTHGGNDASRRDLQEGSLEIAGAGSATLKFPTGRRRRRLFKDGNGRVLQVEDTQEAEIPPVYASLVPITDEYINLQTAGASHWSWSLVFLCLGVTTIILTTFSV